VGRREGEVASWSDGVASFGVLAGLASSGPSVAVFLYGWPHEALGDELCHCLDSRVAEGMQGIEYLMVGRRWDIWSWFTSGCVTVHLDRGTGDEQFFEL
jgi:hypothetical protein